MKENILEVKHLSKKYKSLNAVKDLSFNVQKGEIFGILGPNGAGKTTSLECILGIKSYTTGEVTIFGKNSKKQRKEIFKKTGVQFQNSAWQSGIKVSEICEMTAALYNPMPNWKKAIQEAGLESKMNTFCEKLSGGEQQQLSILLANIHKPKLIFLDELTTGLDPIARRKCWNYIKELQKNGSTIILTSHFMDEVEYLCTRCLLIVNGEKKAEGNIKDIMQIGKSENLEEAYINIVEEINV